MRKILLCFVFGLFVSSAFGQPSRGVEILGICKEFARTGAEMLEARYARKDVGAVTIAAWDVGHELAIALIQSVYRERLVANSNFQGAHVRKFADEMDTLCLMQLFVPEYEAAVADLPVPPNK